MRKPSFAFLCGLLAVAACGSNDIEGTRLDNADLNAESSLFSLALGADGCGVEIPDLGDEMLAAMPECGDGAGRCVPPSPLVPEDMKKQLAPCENGGSCVPLAFLRANVEPLKTCTSYGKVAGVCVSRIVPLVEKLTFLPQDVCSEGERCAPCENPLDGRPTGICEIGKPPSKPAEKCVKKAGAPLQCPYEGKPVLDVTKLTPCADEGMHCLPKAVVPPELADLLAPCFDGNSVCAPDKSIEANGQYVPKTCVSLGGAEGRCLHKDIPQVAAQAKFLPVADCDPFERCIPCFDPLTGAPLPSCSVACDPGPTKPAMVFSRCMGGRGRCVPKSAVPEDMQKNLKDTDCKKGEELCAPVIAIDREAKPQSCQLEILRIKRPGPAVCVEDVLKIGFVLSQSDCPEGFKCTPCNNPLEDDAPTGLPGCPE